MESKRKNEDPPGGKKKVLRTPITLGQKIQILDKLKAGQKSSSLGREYGVNESTIRTIRKNEGKIRAEVRAGTSGGERVKRMSKRIENLNAVEKLDSWSEVKESTLNVSWRSLCPELVEISVELPSVGEDIGKTVDLAKAVGGEGFDDMQEKEVEELQESHQKELMEDELLDLVQANESIEINEDDLDMGNESERSKLSIKSLKEVFNAVVGVQEKLLRLDIM
ncbi:hypothetical protein J437_LFUL014227 [Ladona fulva]|uniref:HTH psq-type domain-containing protein n=1 Tax=Ladona fulva TaxID=123851 RepID=A0A8K0KK45_LADFU|nr:hypothetical protein J437_LFUL014227 [Ladona fulva]